jgi:hypothetical protein
VVPGDHDALEDLDSLLGAFDDPVVDIERVTHAHEGKGVFGLDLVRDD